MILSVPRIHSGRMYHVYAFRSDTLLLPQIPTNTLIDGYKRFYRFFNGFVLLFDFSSMFFF